MYKSNCTLINVCPEYSFLMESVVFESGAAFGIFSVDAAACGVLHRPHLEESVQDFADGPASFHDVLRGVAAPRQVVA